MTIAIYNSQGRYFQHGCAELACGKAYALGKLDERVLIRSGKSDAFCNPHTESRIEAANTILNRYGLPTLDLVVTDDRLWVEVPKTIASKAMAHALMRLERDGGNYLETILEAVASITAAFPDETYNSMYDGSEAFLGNYAHPATWVPILLDRIEYHDDWFKKYRNDSFIAASLVWKGLYHHYIKAYSEVLRGEIVGVDEAGYLILADGRSRPQSRLEIRFTADTDYCLYVCYFSLESVTKKRWKIGGFGEDIFPEQEELK